MRSHALHPIAQSALASVFVSALAALATACGLSVDGTNATLVPEAGVVAPDSGAGGDDDYPRPASGVLDGSASDAGATPEDASAEPDGAPACKLAFPAVTDFKGKGSFIVTKEDRFTTPSLGAAACTIYRPKVLGGGGLHHPVIVWGNGTGTPTVAVYEWLFNQWASHGFIVAAANTSSAGTGAAMLACLDWVASQDTVTGSPYEGHVDLTRAGTSGHSQGGGGAIMAGRDPRIRASVPFMAYTQGLGYDVAAAPSQHGPMLLMSGSADTIAAPEPNQKPVFEASNVATVWGILQGADHVTFALGGNAGFLAPSTAWFRLHLMCDESARPMFYGPACTLCTDPKWAVQRKNVN